MKTTLIYENLSSPITLIQNRNEKDKLYFGDQVGTIFQINTKDKSVKLFLDMRELIVKLDEKYDERGLIDFVFHPDYPIDNRLFIFYSAISGGPRGYSNYLSEFTIRESGNNNSRESEESDEEIEIKEQPLLVIEKEQTHHNGGRMIFGPDGYLYLALGDDSEQGDPENHGQRLDVIFGKILRLDISTPGMYKIPKDNPFTNVQGYKGNTPLIYAFGFRNPWGISFDNSGRLFLADVGYNSVEEIDIVTKGGNYGWSVKEGSISTPFGKGRNITKTETIDPVFEYTHDWIRTFPGFKLLKSKEDLKKMPIAIIGGYSLPDGSYIFGDLCGLIMKIKPDVKGKWILTDSAVLDRFIKGFGRDISGNIYVLCSDKIGPQGNGEIYIIN